ncbi:hypothetical protein L1987_35568 [Smallanthus sonchifolius]|uniref:Uncharacterized protein n=1 Tax=Smallanthus sonchifolius TaxID=185202 RepID=A0ACB9HDE9_9ASTR|nr:hypothetical protein L1987_35568 [Smallanthus sonchifolius]
MDSENTRGVEGVAYLNLGGLTCNAQRKREGREVWLSVIGNGWGWVGTHLTLDTQIWEVESRFAEVGWVWGFNLGWRGRVRCAAGNQADWYVDLGIHIRLEVSQSQGGHHWFEISEKVTRRKGAHVLGKYTPIQRNGMQSTRRLIGKWNLIKRIPLGKDGNLDESSSVIIVGI